MSLLEARKQYKPFEYPWAFEFWKRQQQLHWLPEEVPLGEDCRDWAQKLTDHERNLLTQIFRFFRHPSNTSPSNIRGRSNIGSASSSCTGCPRKCRWARIAATGRRS